MMLIKKIVILSLATSLAGLVWTSRAAEVSLESAPPVVVKTVPVAGATEVDPALKEIRVTFSKAMQDGSWSWSTWGEGTFLEMSGQPRYLSDGRTCVLPVKLQPGKFYATWLNSDKFKNFKDASGRAAVPYLLAFRTSEISGGGGGGAGGLDAKIAQLAKAGTEIGEVIRVLGEPKQYVWDNETFQKDNLPATCILQYAGGVHVLVRDGFVRELRSELPGPGFTFRERLRLGSSLEEMLQVVGQPTATVVGKESEFQPGVLYKDLEGREGSCYYARPEQGIRCFFADNKISALYLPLGEDADLTPPADAQLVAREVNKLVREFPETTDLSTPEAACAAWLRANVNKDAKAISQLSLVPLAPKEQEDWYQREEKRDPEGLAIYLKALGESKIIAVQIWRDQLANVLTYLPFPPGKGRSPYSARCFGFVNGEWKNLGEDRLPELEAAKAGFARKKERLWEQYQQLKPQPAGSVPPGLSPAASTTGATLTPIPKAEALPGKLTFHGRYRHRSRGSDIETPSELWVNESQDGSVNVLARLPFRQSTELASGDPQRRLTSYRSGSEPSGGQPGYRLDLELRDGMAKLTRRGVRQDVDGKELTVPAGAWFDPNARPDSYCAANILLRAFAVREGETKEFRVYDWDNSGEGLADYTIRVKHAGKEKVEVPAGTFDANHLVLTQVISADTWFKKRAGHVTDFWVLDNHVIVRVLRQREPYEMVLLDFTVPEKLDPSSSARAVVAPEKDSKEAATAQTTRAVPGKMEASLQLLNDDQRAVLAWTDRQFRSYFDARNFAGWSDQERSDLETRLIDSLKGPQSRDYFQAINTLGALRSTNALPALRAIAYDRADKNNRDRWMAIRSLGLIGDPHDVPELIRLVYHGNVNTRWWAQISLVRLTGQNFAKDWNAWGKWWNEQNGQPPFKPEIIRWWNGQVDPEKLAESLDASDRKFLGDLKTKS